MHISNHSKQLLESIGGLLVKAIFLVVIWLPNLTFVQTYSAYLKDNNSLQSHLIEHDFAFIDIAKYYACAQIGKVAPKEIWNRDSLYIWFKNYLHSSNLSDQEIANKVSCSLCTPQSVVMFMPFTSFPLNVVVLILELLTLPALIIPTTILIRKYFRFTTSQIVFWWLVALAAAPITIHFYYGQLDGFLAGATALFLLNWQNKNPVWAALCLALTTAIKPQRAIIMLVMSLAGRKFGLLFWTLLISVILFIITAIVLGLEPTLSYMSGLDSIYKSIDNHSLPDAAALTVSILGPVSLIFGTHTAHIISLLATVVSLVGVYVIWQKALKSGEHTYPFAFSTSVLFIFIFAPLQHFYSLIVLCVVWACTVPAVSIKTISKIEAPSLRYWCYFFLAFPVLSWVVSYLASLRAFPGLGHLFILLIMFGLSLCNFRRVLRRNDSTDMISAPT